MNCTKCNAQNDLKDMAAGHASKVSSVSQEDGQNRSTDVSSNVYERLEGLIEERMKAMQTSHEGWSHHMRQSITEATNRTNEAERKLVEAERKLAEAERKLAEAERKLAIAEKAAIDWEKKAKEVEALAEKRAPKLTASTTLFQNPGGLFPDQVASLTPEALEITGSGFMGPTQGPEAAQITTIKQSPATPEVPTFDLTGIDDSKAASSSLTPPNSSHPILSEPPSQSSNVAFNWTEEFEKKELAWLPGGNPLRSHKRPGPYGPGHPDLEYDNTPHFGSFVSTPTGRKTFSEAQREATAPPNKIQRLAEPQKPKASKPKTPKPKTPKPKASSKPRRSEKGKEKEVAPPALMAPVPIHDGDDIKDNDSLFGGDGDDLPNEDSVSGGKKAIAEEDSSFRADDDHHSEDELIKNSSELMDDDTFSKFVMDVEANLEAELEAE